MGSDNARRRNRAAGGRLGLATTDLRIPHAALACLTGRRSLGGRLHVGPRPCTLGGPLPTLLPPASEALAEVRLRRIVRRRHSRFLLSCASPDAAYAVG